MKFFDASRYASPLRKALAKKENAPRNLRFETLENRALLSVTPLDELQAAVASAEIAPAQIVETPVVDLSALAVSNATTETLVDLYEPNDTLETAYDLGTPNQTTTLEAVANARLNGDYYKVTFEAAGTDKYQIVLDGAWHNPTSATAINLKLHLLDADGNPLASGAAGKADSKSVSLKEVEAGKTYYIYVEQDASQSFYNHDHEAAYTLTITPPVFPKDVYAPNHAPETAYDLGVLGSATLDATTGLNQECDYFKFSTATLGGADDSVEITYNVANANLMLALFDADNFNPDAPIANVTTTATTKTISLANVPAGDYYVRVYNLDADAKEAVEFTLAINATVAAPAAPTNFKTSGDEATNNYTTLSWDNVPGETGYELEVSVDDGAWTLVQTYAADATTSGKLDLAFGTKYQYRLRAVNATDADNILASDWVELDDAFTTAVAPEPPTGLKKASVLDSETLTLQLAWDDLDNELGYVVDLLDADGAVVAQSDLLDADTTTWTTPALALGTTYKFQVTAKNNAGDATSELFSFTTENVPTAQPVLTATVVPSATAPTATLKWGAVDTATAYVVEQLVVDGETETWTAVQTLENGETEWTTAVEANATYAYRVVAANAYGSGVPSEAVEFTPDAASTTVTTLDDVVNPADGLVSLREAIQYAEVGATVTFAETLKGATFKLGGVCLQIDKAIAIDGSFETGAPQITLDADAKSRVFNVEAGTVDAPVKLVGLTITNGYADVVDDRMQYGGGIRVGANAALDVANSKIVGNRSTERGGGVYLSAGSTGNFTNVEINDNVGRFYGGGVAVGSNASATFRNATIIGQSNVSNQTGIDVDANSVVKFYNSIVQYVGTSQETQTLEAYNTASDFTDWTNADEEGVVNYELDATQPLFTDATKGDYTLADGSQALNKGDNAYVAYVPETLTTDLAGNARLSGRVDLGAYEFQGVATPAPTGLTATVNPSTAPTATLTWAAVKSDTIAETVAGYEVTLYQVEADGTVVAFTPQTVTEATYTTETLDFGGTYYFEVAAVNAYGKSEVAKSKNFTVGTVPTAPTDITFGQHNEAKRTLAMSWTDNSNNETLFRVEYTKNGSDWQLAQTLSANTTSRFAGGIDVNCVYSFRVRAENAYGASAWTVATYTSKPAAPTQLTAVVNASTEPTATLTWADNAKYENGYVVEQLVDGEWSQVAELEANALNWTTDVQKGATYVYRVVAVNAYGETASEAVEVVVGNVPTAPTELTATVDASATPSATLTWDAVKTPTEAEVVTAYVVTVYNVDGETVATQTVENATEWTVENLLMGATYTFDVVAVNAYGESVASEATEFTVGNVPTAPTGLTAIVNPSTAPTATLTWNAAVSDAIAETVAGYEVTLYQVEADGTVVAFAPQTVADATYTTETLDFGGTYYFEVAAVNAYGKSEATKSKNFTVGTVPTAPTELTADLDEAALTATLSWTVASNHTGYRVELQTQNADGETVWETVDNLDVDALTWSTEVAVDTTYLYRVVAWSAYGETASETVEVVVENVPTQPTDAKYSVDYVDKASTLTWTAVDGATGYVVEQLGADGAWATVAGSETTETIWTSAALDFGTSYSFRVVAKNAYGSSDASDAVSFDIQAKSSVVTTLEDGYNLTDDKITLREAIYYAEAGDTITFAETLKGGTLTLTDGSLSIMEKEISVRGFVDENGAPELTIDGDRKAMIFRVANTRASFFGLTVVNGVAAYEMYGDGAYGGGFCFYNANAILTNVDVIGCQADVYGGGVYIASNVDAAGQGKSTLTNVRILDNVADNGDAAGDGGGLYATGGLMSGKLEMTNVEISGNRTRLNGGGLFLNDMTSTLTNVKITDNIAAGNGGAFYANAPDHTETSDLTGAPLIVISTKLTNVEITGNQAYKGFGFYAEEYDVEELSLRNVTFADNVGTEDGAFADVYLKDGAATFYNSIFVGDVQGTTDSAANAYNTLSSFTGWANATEDGVVNYVLNEGDSVFKDAANDDYTLAADSVALNKGDVAYLDASITTDLAGNPRVYNETPDLGAYESLAPTAPSNITFGDYVPKTGKLEMSWGAAANVENYRVEATPGVEPSEDAQWNSFIVAGDKTSRYANIGRQGGGTFTFRVRAENAQGYSEWVYATYIPSVRQITFGVYAPQTGKLEMNWGAVVNAENYRVEATLGAEPSEDAQWNSFIVAGDKTSRYANIGTSGATFTFRVRAESANEHSEWVYATYSSAIHPTLPGAITFGDYVPKTGKLEMSWGAAANVENYRVEATPGVEPSEDAQWNSFIVAGDKTSRYANIGRQGGGTFTFRVRAENAQGYSEWVYATYIPATASDNNSSSVVSDAFADFFEEDLEDDFWFEFEKVLNMRVK